MSPQALRTGTRTARKPHRCGMCNSRIAAGDAHHVSTNVFDDRVYDFRTCADCERDGVLAFVYEWAGQPDEGVAFDTACEWAQDVVRWPDGVTEKAAATAFAARAHLPTPCPTCDGAGIVDTSPPGVEAAPWLATDIDCPECADPDTEDTP